MYEHSKIMNPNPISNKVYCNFQSVLEKLEINNCTINISNLEEGRNIAGIISRVQARDDYGKGRSYYFIIKTAPSDKDVRAFLHITSLFSREIYIYSKVIPEMENLQKNITEPFQSYAKFYGATSENMYESVIMRDMSKVGYTLLNPEIPLDYHHTLLVLKEYGKFHALSYALRDQKPVLFKELSKNTCESFFTTSETAKLRQTFVINAERALKALNPTQDKDAYEKYQKFMLNMDEVTYNALQAGAAGQYAVIGHGDCWMNNLLFKYDDSGSPNKPTNVCFLDWQFSRIGSPALDLSYFLFTATDKKLRDQYYDHLIYEYYNSLYTFFSKLGGDPKSCIPYEVLQEHLQRFSVYGLYIGTQAIHIMLQKAKQTTNVGSSKAADVFTNESQNTEKFNERIRDVILDFVSFDYNLS